MILIPLPTTPKPFFSLSIALEGTFYVLSFEWNMRSGWYLGVSQTDGTIIYAPRRMMPSWDILAGCTTPGRPPGRLILVDSTDANERPLYENFFSGRYGLFYENVN